MIEPEMAFYDLDDNMGLAESFLKYILELHDNSCKEDLRFLDERLSKEQSQKPKMTGTNDPFRKIKFTIDNKFVKISYSDVEI